MRRVSSFAQNSLEASTKSMKRLFFGVLFAITGIFCGVVIAICNSAFYPRDCGEDCVKLGELLIWTTACSIVFPLIGLAVWSRTSKGLGSVLTIAGVLTIISTFPAIAIYGHKLHQRYWAVAWRQEIPDLDFAFMTISTKPVIAVLEGTGSKVSIKAWERCAISGAYCDNKPAHVKARCLADGKVVAINESDWLAFQRIPEEDLQGLIDKPTDMHLCSRQ